MLGFQKFNVIKRSLPTRPSLFYMNSNATPKRCLPYIFVWEEVTVQPNSDWRWQGVRKSLRLSWQVADNRTMLFYSKFFKWFLDDFSFLHSANSFWLFLFLLHAVKILMGANIRFLLMVTIQFLTSFTQKGNSILKLGTFCG